MNGNGGEAGVKVVGKRERDEDRKMYCERKREEWKQDKQIRKDNYYKMEEIDEQTDGQRNI